ncbi:sugar ABC transporter permease [uncultured Sphaerochaeta sp.]|uniref:carbohydrate ABC transporter permease n=1 Tax=uncultured Sphaerochaeta sp. TaxID=886478 RepID=UPI002A0A7DCC|nr:sugar ABC transporter permease [uncultured Sphaerochaeta sp.]
MDISVGNNGKRIGRQGIRRKRIDVIPYLFVFPAVTILASFLIVPVIMATKYSFSYFNLLKPNAITFVGFDNYKRLLSDEQFFISMKNTLYYALVLVPILCALAFMLALLVNNHLKGVSLFRIAYFSPMLTSMTVVAILWTFIFNPTPGQGLLNSFLVRFGIQPCPFLRDSHTAMNSIIGMSVWQSVGNYMMIYLAGLQSLPSELYEAASIDGASEFRKILFITIPGLHNVTVFIVLMTTISALKMFTQSYVMTQGGPDNATRTIVYYIYQQGLQFRNIGYASSASVIFFFVVLCISFLIKKFIDTER